MVFSFLLVQRTIYKLFFVCLGVLLDIDILDVKIIYVPSCLVISTNILWNK